MTDQTPPPNIRHSVHLNGLLSIYSASGDLPRDMVIQDPIEDGLKIVVSNVVMDLRASGMDGLRFSSPTAFAILSDGEHEREQKVYAAPGRWDVAVSLDRNLVEQEFGCPPEKLFLAEDHKPLIIKAVPADTAMKAMVTQLLTLPDTGASAMMRLASGLNLAAAVLGAISKQNDSGRQELRSIDLERVTHAQDIMRRNLATAPDMRVLARRTGTNAAKLTRDFKVVTGMTPHAWLQENRLEAAWQMLASRSCTVAQAAHSVGYAPAHFSTLFRRRFDTPPSTLIHGGAD